MCVNFLQRVLEQQTKSPALIHVPCIILFFCLLLSYADVSVELAEINIIINS